MNLLLATDHYLPHPGGSSRVIYETSRRLVARGHTVTILTFERDLTLPPHDEIGGVPVQRIPLRGRVSTYPRALVGAYRASAQARRNLVPDVAHVHLPLIGPGTIAAARLGQTPVVASFYGPWADEMHTELSAKPLPGVQSAAYGAYLQGLCSGLGLWQGRLLRQADRIILLSRYSRQQVSDLASPEIAARTELIPGGVDLQRFCPHPDRAALRRQLGVPSDATFLFTVRRLVPRMGLENLLEAVALLRRAHFPVYLVIGGRGPLEAGLREQAAALDLEDRTRFTGFIPDDVLPTYYQAADLFVLPTTALEGFGLITLEALACGTPVVGTPQGSTTDLLGGFDPRLLAGSARPEDLAAAIRDGCEIARREGQDLRGRCREYASRFDWELIVDRYEAVYRQASEKRRV